MKNEKERVNEEVYVIPNTWFGTITFGLFKLYSRNPKLLLKHFIIFMIFGIALWASILIKPLFDKETVAESNNTGYDDSSKLTIIYSLGKISQSEYGEILQITDTEEFDDWFAVYEDDFDQWLLDGITRVHSLSETELEKANKLLGTPDFDIWYNDFYDK